MSSIAEKIRNKKPVLGTWCDLPCLETVNVLAKAGLDFVIIDMEHGPMGFETAQSMVISATAEGTESFIRVCRNDESEIGKALDVGAVGIIVPHIETESDCKKVVKYSKFYPVGNRGLNPYVRSGGYYGIERDYCEKQNKKSLIGVIVEGKVGLKNLASICSVPCIDIIYIGTYDLSVSLGLPGQVKHPDVVRALEKSVKTISISGKCVGCMAHTVDEIAYLCRMGVGFITYKVDTAVLYESFSVVTKEFRKL